ncbi:alpha/beta hydrolase [soil metagenome]
MSDPDLISMVDPDLRSVLATLPDLASLSNETLPALRASMSGLPTQEAPEGLEISRVTIKASHGEPDVPALLYCPTGAAPRRPALLYLHGGGYVSGSAERDDPAVRDLALATGAVILSVDYRLAPETPFPGPLYDAYDALAWLHHQAETLGVDRNRIAVRGNSAGGGLAAGLALLARDRGEYPIAFLVLVYPMLDDRTQPHPVNGRYVWTPASNAFGWNAYLGSMARDAEIGHAVPARADDLSGLPPTWIGCGGLDLFLDENLAFAQRLVQAGVATELHVYPGAYHGFNLIVGAAVSQRFERDLRSALSRAFTV